VNLLQNIFYGTEINNQKALLRWAETMVPDKLSHETIQRILDEITTYFSRGLRGIFGGPITAGDAVMIAAIMEMVRPSEMVEIGVASGFSSSFILGYAKSAGLLTKDEVFLHSVDLEKEHAPDKQVGSFLFSHFPELVGYWDLQTEVTSAKLLRGENYIHFSNGARIVAFVDGGHNHPWPVVDLIYLHRILPTGSWVVMQDARMMERWIADCVVHNVPSPAPVRGVDFAVSHWPGTKIFGFDTSYNSAAVCLDITDGQLFDFVKTMRRYPNEITFVDDDIFALHPV
jgi:cephalosporin hydroxylase